MSHADDAFDRAKSEMLGEFNRALDEAEMRRKDAARAAGNGPAVPQAAPGEQAQGKGDSLGGAAPGRKAAPIAGEAAGNRGHGVPDPR